MNTTGFKNPEFDGVTRHVILFITILLKAKQNLICTLLNQSDDIILQFRQFSSSGVSVRAMLRSFNEFYNWNIEESADVLYLAFCLHYCKYIYYDLLPWISNQNWINYCNLIIDVSKKINVLRSIFAGWRMNGMIFFYTNTLKKKKKKHPQNFAEIFKTEQILLSSSAFVQLWQVTDTRIIRVKCEIRRRKIKNKYTLADVFISAF